MHAISEQQFQGVLETRLGPLWHRALKVFRDFGSNLSFDVATVLLHADMQGKVEEVLGILEAHYSSHLQFQHPDIRGQVGNRLLSDNPTETMFRRIRQETLGLRDP